MSRRSGSKTPSPSDPEEPKSPEGRDGEEDSSTASSTASASPFVSEPGPDFDPEAGGGEPEATLTPLPELDGWEEETVRSVLVAQGVLAHGAIGVAETDWAYTEADLSAIAPPLTRILNRYDATRAAAGTGDELALMIGLGGYVSRSYRERVAALEDLAEEEPVPITGVPAPEPLGEDEPPAEPVPAEDLDGLEFQT